HLHVYDRTGDQGIGLVFGVVGALVLAIQAGAGTLARSYDWLGIATMLVVLLGDACLVVLLVAVLLVRGNLPKTAQEQRAHAQTRTHYQPPTPAPARDTPPDKANPASTMLLMRLSAVVVAACAFAH